MLKPPRRGDDDEEGCGSAKSAGHFPADEAVAARTNILWVSDDPAPPNVRQAVRQRWHLRPYRAGEPLVAQLRSSALAVAFLNGQAEDPRRLAHLMDAVDRADAVAVVLLPAAARTAWEVLARHEGKLLCVRDDSSAEELVARLEAAEALQPAIHKLQEELLAARTIAPLAGESLEGLDEEMRLAARLQRDFLPRRLPEVGRVRFGVLYRPLGWVSGDIYEVARLDETHVGFYVADAVGHGLPAALLTMFIKKALQTKRIEGRRYQIVPPHAALAQLNADICEQNLTSCQFCTAAYAVLDTSDLTLTHARAGHPEPLLVHADGTFETLPAEGVLLGVFPGAEYVSATFRLSPGDRLVLYSDGAEEALGGVRRCRDKTRRFLASQCRRGRQEMLLHLTAVIDERRSDRQAADDVTILVADVLPDA